MRLSQYTLGIQYLLVYPGVFHGTSFCKWSCEQPENPGSKESLPDLILDLSLASYLGWYLCELCRCAPEDGTLGIVWATPKNTVSTSTYVGMYINVWLHSTHQSSLMLA